MIRRLWSDPLVRCLVGSLAIFAGYLVTPRMGSIICAMSVVVAGWCVVLIFFDWSERGRYE